MRRIIPVMAVVLMALPVVARAAPPPPPPGDFPAPDPQVMQLHREIAALKLDKLLNLTRDQARALLPLVRQGQQLREQAMAEHEQRKAAIVRALTAVRDDLKRTGTVSPESQKALEAARPGPNDQVRTAARDLRQRAQDILTGEQLRKLRDFDPRPVAGPGGFGGPDDEMGPPQGGPGPGGEAGPQGGPGGRGGHGKMGGMHRGHHLMHLVLTPEFQQLLEARAK